MRTQFFVNFGNTKIRVKIRNGTCGISSGILLESTVEFLFEFLVQLPTEIAPESIVITARPEFGTVSGLLFDPFGITGALTKSIVDSLKWSWIEIYVHWSITSECRTSFTPKGSIMMNSTCQCPSSYSCHNLIFTNSTCQCRS